MSKTVPWDNFFPVSIQVRLEKTYRGSCEGEVKEYTLGASQALSWSLLHDVIENECFWIIDIDMSLQFKGVWLHNIQFYFSLSVSFTCMWFYGDLVLFWSRGMLKTALESLPLKHMVEGFLSPPSGLKGSILQVNALPWTFSVISYGLKLLLYRGTFQSNDIEPILKATIFLKGKKGFSIN